MRFGTGICRSRWTRSVVVAGCMLLVWAAPAAADTTISVNTTMSSSPSGDGLCSLWEAIDWSQGGYEPDCSTGAPSGTTTIDLPAGRYVVPQTLRLNYTLDIVGAGASNTNIDGGGSHQVMYAYPTADVTISGVEISGGESGTASCSSICTTPEPGNDGGGIYNDGTMTLRNDLVTGNATGSGIAGLQLCIFASCAGNSGDPGGNGGGIYNSGTLTIEDSTVSGNSTGAGAAGALGVTVGTSAGEPGGHGGNGGGGGGIYNNAGTLTVTDSTISGNSTGPGGNGGDGSAATQAGANGGDAGYGGFGGSGGGIDSSQGSMTITGSTLSGNTTGAGSTAGSPGAGNGSGVHGANSTAGSAGDGGAIDYVANSGHTAALTNDTLTGNSTGAAAAGADPAHGGIAGGIAFWGTGSLNHVTIADNTATYAAGALYVIPTGSAITEQKSIIASNTAGLFGNCAGLALIDGGHNLVYGDDSCPGTFADPKLEALADNGGPTQTMRLGAGSAAVDEVPTGSCGATTDQRGLARPQGGGCDAGAYEVAPPQIASPAASVTGPESAEVTAQVTPNLTDTKMVLRYGTSTSYSTSVPSDLGSGSAAKPYLVMLNGLRPSTTYHFQVQATNADGTTASNDVTFTTPAAISLSTRGSAAVGDVISFRLGCVSGGSSCTGSLVLSSHVTTLGRRVIAVSASAGHRRSRPRRRRVVVGLGHYSLQAGHTATIRLSLNAYGRRLLRTRHRLPATLTASGAPSLARKVRFVYRAPHHRRRR